jgi:ABC-type antimicrobial peptide transport system permease subunit
VVAESLRAELKALDPHLPLYNVKTLSKEIDESLVQERMVTWLSSAFGLLAMLLAALGIYGVLTFSVARRTREIGIRVALGASRWRIVAPIFARPLRQVAGGVAAGGALTAALLLLMFGGEVSPRGVTLLAAHMALMLVVCMFACVVPTRRALRIEPTEALRADA